jgi:TFIIF-interacting CTD phosphatases, including NLI-interacting factor
MKRLIILDLDNTLIYGTYEIGLSAKILLRYSNSILIYERPYAREFIQKCHEVGDVIIVTTAIKDYAESIIKALNIKCFELYSREDCLIQNDYYMKCAPDFYFDLYDEIIIVDDSPEIWDKESQVSCKFIIPTKFFGDGEDTGLEFSKQELIKIAE